MKQVFRANLLSCIAAFTLLMGATAQSRAEYIFGFTGGSPNYLDVTTTTGSFVLGTDVSPITSANNQGWWSATFPNINANDNFFVGDSGGNLLNDFFTFDISALTGTVLDVTLNIQNPGSNSTANGVTYYVYDVSTDAVTLNTKDNSPNGAIYTDLGSGTLYGTQFVPSINPAQYFIGLNGSAVSDLQGAIDSGSHYFSTGGTITPLEATVPEPATLTIWALGALGCAFAARRRKVA